MSFSFYLIKAMETCSDLKSRFLEALQIHKKRYPSFNLERLLRYVGEDCGKMSAALSQGISGVSRQMKYASYQLWQTNFVEKE